MIIVTRRWIKENMCKLNLNYKVMNKYITPQGKIYYNFSQIFTMFYNYCSSEISWEKPYKAEEKR